eukprot:m.270283 g.270283  ORF g.270283 m.270283 type:complete len:83 (+) comp19312_c1_seq9:200-448(+)
MLDATLPIDEALGENGVLAHHFKISDANHFVWCKNHGELTGDDPRIDELPTARSFLVDEHFDVFRIPPPETSVQILDTIFVA